MQIEPSHQVEAYEASHVETKDKCPNAPWLILGEFHLQLLFLLDIARSDLRCIGPRPDRHPIDVCVAVVTQQVRQQDPPNPRPLLRLRLAWRSLNCGHLNCCQGNSLLAAYSVFVVVSF